MNRKHLLSGVAGFSLWAGIAYAQSPQPLSEVVVTAQRREESLQNVPIAVSVMRSEALERLGIGTTDDLTMVTPGLQITQERNAVQPFLRGVGAPVSGPLSDPAVAVYVDGVYFPYPAGALFSLNNIDRIEVLKGPQGTLFGRNSTGGLIQIITRKPSQEPQGKLSLGYGNYNTVTASAYVTGGLTSTLAADLAGFYVKQDKGWGENLLTGEDINLREEYSLRSKLRWEPNDDFSAELALDYVYSSSDYGVYRNAVPGSLMIDGRSQIGTIYDTRTEVRPYARMRQAGAALVMNYDFGPATLTSTSSYRRFRTVNAFDQDSTPIPRIAAVINEDVQGAEQEFLLNGSVDRLSYTAGAFIFWSSGEGHPQGIRSDIAAQNSDLFVRQITKSYSGFAQGTYQVSDQTNLTLGLRYTTESRNLSGYRLGVAPNPAAGRILQTQALLGPGGDKRTYNKLTWRAAIDHHLSDAVMAYASASRGFKSGSFASNLTNQATRPEVLDAYAVGVKSTMLGGTLRFNAEAFYYDYKDLQVTLYEAGISNLLNAAAAEVKGLDVEVTWLPPVSYGRLLITGSFSLLDTKYTDFRNAPGFVRFPGTPIPANYTGCSAVTGIGGSRQCSVNATGNKLQRAPDWTSSVALDYSAPLSANYEVGIGVNWYHNDGFFWHPENRVRQSAYDVVNGQVRFGAAEGAWTVRLFAQNLLKEKYYTQMSAGTFGDQASPGAPRTYGIALDVKLQ